MSINALIDQLTPIAEALKQCTTPKQKLKVLKPYQKNFDNLPLASQVILASLSAIGQDKHILTNYSSLDDPKAALAELISDLAPIDEFYQSIGGIVGYHLTFLKLLSEKNISHNQYEKPPGFAIDKQNGELKDAIYTGITSLPIIAEIYPVAGAADRLNLHHETTGEALPAAELPFIGSTLLERLVTDLQAREYLYFKLKNKQIVTPIVLMTSFDKNNDNHITAILRKKNYFGRPHSQFYRIVQPLVPVITADGNWAIKAPLQLILKPGGHGILWKIAKDQGAFSWLKKQKRKKAIIRQINNPIAGIDNTLTALTGFGCRTNRSFGFVSCERIVKAAEGMDVLIKRKTSNGYEYLITNVEYTDFEKQGIKDKPSSKKTHYSQFPANTNILFADLKEVEKISDKHPFPGKLINLKTPILCLKDEEGTKEMMPAGRIECTMQNIADYMVYKSKHSLSKEEIKKLKTFILYNTRLKTLAVTKKLHQPGQPIQDAPEGALWQMLNVHHDLLKQCGFKLPPKQTEAEFVKKGPNLFFTYHPALGPLFSIISQKLRKGKISPYSELKLDIAEIDLENLNLQGSLVIKADQIMGHVSKQKGLHYSNNTGKCVLKNVKVVNEGLEHNPLINYWKHQVLRKEALIINIEGNGEFVAKNVVFKGNQRINVPAGYRLTAVQKGLEIEFKLEKITKPTWFWKYKFDRNHEIKLTH